jgi:hypothetical protein
VDRPCCFCFGACWCLSVRINTCIVVSFVSSVMDLKKYNGGSATIPVILTSDNSDIKW